MGLLSSLHCFGKSKQKKKAKGYDRKKVPKKCSVCMTKEDLLRLDPAYKNADEFSQFFMTSAKGTNLRRLMIQLGVKRRDVTYFFKLFMRIDEDDSGMITLDEFFKYLKTEWSPFIGKAFHQFDSDQEGMSADQLEPDEWMVGLINYCTLTPEALCRFAFELYDDDGSEFISHDELATMVDDVFGDDFDKEEHVKQLISILDSDGDGVIEYDEWRKVSHKATSILKPAIILQAFLQSRCFGETWWFKLKSRVIPIVAQRGYPNILQFYKKEIVSKRPDAKEAEMASAWLGEEVNDDKVLSSFDSSLQEGNAAALNLKGLLKAKSLARSVHEKRERERDPTKHGFNNPFRGGKVINTYGAVKIKEGEEIEFIDEGALHQFGDTGPTEEQLRELQIEALRKQAPQEMPDGSLVYPDGTVVNKVHLKDRSSEKDGKTKKKTIIIKNKRGKEQEIVDPDEEKRDREYRLKMVKYARAEADLMLAKWDLYDGHVEKKEKQPWEMKLRIGSHGEAPIAPETD